MGIISSIVNNVKDYFGWGTSQQTASSAQDKARLLQGNSALAIYSGNVPRALTVKAGQPDDNVFVGYPTTIVDKGVAFLFGDQFKIEVGDSTDTQPEDYLAEVWPEDQRSEDFIDLGTDGGCFGDAWLKINIEPDGKPAVTVSDPGNMFADVDPNNYRRVLVYRCQYPRLDSNGKQVLYKEETSRDEGNSKRWVIREYESINEGRTWYQIGEDVYWNFEFPPYYHTKNLPKSKSFYGTPDLTKNVLDLSKYLSRLDSLLGKTTRVHSSPKPIGKNMDKQDLKIGTDEILFLGQGAERTIELLEMKGDLAGAIAFRKILREALAEISHVPEVATGKLESIGQLSGLALKIMYGPLIDRTNVKRRLYGRLIKDVVYALLAIGRIQVKKKDIKLQWPDPVPSDPLEEANASLAREQVGFSKDTEVQRLGGDPDNEKKKREEEAASDTVNMMKNFNNGNLGGDVYQTTGQQKTQPVA